ncbi:MAG TPA: hypothetical protein VK427_21325, partial [Kofleriaceae bacterium]|nr:hypothetical protein [Kofleriaceae bacterium]
VVGDYAREDWPALLIGPFDVVVTMQTVHELRHKRHARPFYERVHGLLHAGGAIVVCDHEPQDARPLHMTVAEQHAALAAVGFSPTTIAEIGGLYVIAATRS